jgi:hypothetical protein
MGFFRHVLYSHWINEPTLQRSLQATSSFRMVRQGLFDGDALSLPERMQHHPIPDRARLAWRRRILCRTNGGQHSPLKSLSPWFARVAGSPDGQAVVYCPA